MRIEFTDGPRKGDSVEVDKDRVTVGRDSSSDVVVDDEEVSRSHAELRVSDGRVEVRDLGSQNGTKVGGSRISDSHPLSPGDEVRIGNATFTVDAGNAGRTRVAGSTRGGTRTGGGTRMAGSVPAMLEVVSGPDQGKTADVSGKGITIGRGNGADLSLSDDESSREHVEVRANQDGSLEVRDLGSRNGTTVNGNKITRTVNVSDGDEIGIGRTRIKVNSLTAGAGARRRAPATVGGNRRVWGIAAAVAGVAVLAIVLIVALSGGGDESNDSSAPLTTPELVQKLNQSTVSVAGTEGGRRYPLGSGWVLDNQAGLIVTNAHVVEGTPTSPEGFVTPVTSFEINTENSPPRRADIFAVAPCEDLAVLRVGGITDLPNMELGSQSDLQAGEKAVALGFPSSAVDPQETPLQVNEGTVVVPEERADVPARQDPDYAVYENVVQMDTPINPGNSGGPLVNDRGQLIGVNTLGGEQNQNYAVGVDRVKEITDQLRSGDSLAWGGFGFVGKGNGLEVTKVFPNTGSDESLLPTFEQTLVLTGGLPVLIRALNNRPVSTRGDYCNAAEGLSAGESAVVRLGVPGRKGRIKGRIVFE